MRRLLRGVTVACAALLAGLAGAEELAPASLVGGGAVIEDDGGGVSMTIDLSRPIGWRLWLEDEPPRVVLELADIDWTDEPEQRSTSILGVQVVETGPNLVELHSVLREPLGILSAEMTAADDGSAALDIRLTPITADAWQADVEGVEYSAEQSADRLVIAIDPGHGGTDPGAESGDIQEADLVLGFARRLRDILVASGQFDVVLTRDEDVMLSLDARLSRAREAGADVLLSLHADALAVPGAASGIVLYRLSREAQSAANQRLRERHAPEDQLSGIDLSTASEDVTHALLDLARQKAVPRTEALSAALLQAFQGADLVVNSNPERSGAFAVLKAADIPSLLIELGFLSTEEDLARLTSEDWQTSVAEAVRDGLLLWAEEDQLR